MNNTQTISITTAAERIAKALVIPLDAELTSFEDMDKVISILSKSAYSDVVIKSRKTGAAFNLITAKSYISSIKEHFDSPKALKAALLESLIPFIMKEIEEDAEKTAPQALPKAPLE